MGTMYDTEEEFEHKGHKFTLMVEHDPYMGAPWDEHDGHGPVSGWTKRDKAPGERVLHADGRSKRFYDFAEAIKIAKRDGWDAPPYTQGTPGERAARAVEADFKYLQRWCNDDWWWVVVTVKCLETGETRSLGGVSSDEGDYVRQDVAIDLADELIETRDKAHEQAVLTRKNQLDELEAIVRNHGMEGIMAAERRERFDNFLTNHFGPAGRLKEERMISPYTEGDFVLDLTTTNDSPGHLAAHWLGLSYAEWANIVKDKSHWRYDEARKSRIIAKEVLFPYLYGTKIERRPERETTTRLPNTLGVQGTKPPKADGSASD